MRSLVLLTCLLAIVAASILSGPIHLDFSNMSEVQSLVLWDIRIPRTMAALWIGASLGLSGALLQTLLKNSLAEPYTLGLSGAASFGAVSAITLGLTPLDVSMPLAATVMCIATAVLILSLSARQTLAQSKTLILTGVMISLFFGSLVILILSLLKPDELRTALFWMMGQVGTERDRLWYYVAIMFLITSLWSAFKIKDLDRILLGEGIARSLGTNVTSISYQIVVLVSLLVATCVSVSGLIGFVGLLAPHLAKLIYRTHRHSQFLYGSALTGALLLLTSDVLARCIGGEKEIPTGGLVALFGAPMLIYLLQKRGSYASH